MGRQALAPKTVRRYAKATGLPIERMLARGCSGHWVLFVTTDHRHGAVRAGTFEVDWDIGQGCWSSCPREEGNGDE